MRFAIDAGTDLVRHVAVSSDGRYVAYGAGRSRELFLKRRDRLEPVRQEGTSAIAFPSISPDGRWVAFTSGGDLMKAPIAEVTPPELVATNATGGFGITWLDDQILVFGRNDGLYTVPAGGGEPRQITVVDTLTTNAHIIPRRIPGRREFLYTSWPNSFNNDDAVLMKWSAQTGESAEVIDGHACGEYVPGGYLIYCTTQVGTALRIVPFDLDAGVVKGVPVAFLPNAHSTWSYGFSEDGVLAYGGSFGESTDRVIVRVDRQGVERPVSTEAGILFDVRVSPDGSRIVVSRGSSEDATTNTDANVELWILDAEDGRGSQLTFGGRSEYPAWTHDGRVVFESDQSGSPTQLYSQPADGSEPASLVADVTAHLHPMSVSKSGLLVVENLDNSHLGIVDQDSGTLTRFGPEGDDAWDEPAFSPDGRWIAYRSDELGNGQVFVASYPYTGSRWRVSPDGGREPRWSSNGEELYFLSSQGLMAVRVEGSGGRFQMLSSPEVLFDGPGILDYDVLPDGSGFVAIKQPVTAEDGGATVNIVLNWTDELDVIAPRSN
jgi:serine/threonine-protein kinase